MVRAVDGVDVAVSAGEPVALLGPNGAGKTTTIDMLLGLLPPDGGAVSLFGKPPADAIARGGVGAFLSLLGGVWFPITSSRALHDLAEALPSFWLVQASHVALGGSGWDGTGWLVVSVWVFAMAALAARAYRRDTARP